MQCKFTCRGFCAIKRHALPENWVKRMTIELKLGRRERKKLERREEILECAAGLFKRHGFDGTSVEAIAEAADVSLRTFYNFFPTKLDVLVAVNILSIRERLGRALAVLADPPQSPNDGLFRMVEAHFRAFDQMDRDLLIRGSIHGLVQGPHNAGGVDYAMYDAFSLGGDSTPCRTVCPSRHAGSRHQCRRSRAPDLCGRKRGVLQLGRRSGRSRGRRSQEDATPHRPCRCREPERGDEAENPRRGAWGPEQELTDAFRFSGKTKADTEIESDRGRPADGFLTQRK